MTDFRFHTQMPEKPVLLKNFGDKTWKMNNRYLTKNGKPHIPISGEMQYSRIPRKYWEEELDKMKEAGIELISTYIFWIHHEEIQGEFSWEGNRNLGEFMDLCKERELGVILRIGPWVHGESRNGGFPDWILKECGKNTRCNDEKYLGYVRTYYQRIKEHIGDRELFAVQIENELVNNLEHLAALYEMAKECGLCGKFYTATAWGFDMSSLSDRMISMYGGYPEQPWYGSTGPSLPNPHYFFTGVRSDGNIGNDLLIMKDVVQDESVPFCTCETGPGIPVTHHRRPLISAEDALSMAVCVVGEGSNWLGFYVFHGGTNPMGRLSALNESRATGYPNDYPVFSYDFQAPIGECGYRKESYYRIKSFLHFLQNFGEKLAPMIPVYPDIRPSGLEDTETLRCCLRSDGKTGFLFVNNHHHGKILPEHHEVTFTAEFAEKTTEFQIPLIPTDSTFVIPLEMKLSDELTLEYAFAQPVSVKENEYYFERIEGIEPVFHFSDGTEIVIAQTAVLGDTRIHVCERERAKEETGTEIAFSREAEYSWKLENIPQKEGVLRIYYYGDILKVYCDGKFTAEQYYYGDFAELYLPEKTGQVRIEIQPLRPEQDVYLECERRNGGELEHVLFFENGHK